MKVKLVHGGGGGGGGGGDEKVGMALLGWDSLLQGGIQSRLTPTHHFDFEDAASNAPMPLQVH